jgi:hypothetical protein
MRIYLFELRTSALGHKGLTKEISQSKQKANPMTRAASSSDTVVWILSFFVDRLLTSR